MFVSESPEYYKSGSGDKTLPDDQIMHGMTISLREIKMEMTA
jgi:hypothetical protein